MQQMLCDVQFQFLLCRNLCNKKPAICGLFFSVPGMALNSLVKVQPRVYIAKCRKAQGS